MPFSRTRASHSIAFCASLASCTAARTSGMIRRRPVAIVNNNGAKKLRPRLGRNSTSRSYKGQSATAIMIPQMTGSRKSLAIHSPIARTPRANMRRAIRRDRTAGSAVCAIGDGGCLPGSTDLALSQHSPNSWQVGGQGRSFKRFGRRQIARISGKKRSRPVCSMADR